MPDDPIRTATLLKNSEEVLARTLFGEARGEDRRGREMVANVVMNRVNTDLGNDGRPDWWGEGVLDVCLRPFQFSCWHDPNRPKLLAVTPVDPVFRECLAIARAAVSGDPSDYTNGATHYLNMPLTLKLYGRLPSWAIKHNWRAEHGRHSFFRVL